MEEVFDLMAFAVVAAVKRQRVAAIGFGGNADEGVASGRLGDDGDIIERCQQLRSGLRAWTWPAVSTKSRARPLPSTTSCSLLLRPPLVRPMAYGTCPPRGLEPCWRALRWAASKERNLPQAPSATTGKRLLQNPESGTFFGHQKRISPLENIRFR